MSNSVFPTLPGKTWPLKKKPTFRTEVHRAVSGREVRVPMMAYPLWEFDLKYNVLRDQATSQSPAAPFDELKTLVGFFLARNGPADSFLFNDDTDNACADQLIGTGDGNTTAFQLVRAYGNFVEPVQNANVVSAVKINDVTQNVSNYSVGSTGIVTFNSAPGANMSVKWTGTYYFRCRFLDDDSEFSAFMYNLWENQKVSFVGAPGNKV